MKVKILKSLTIPASITSIEYDAFEGSTALSQIKYRGSQSQWKELCKSAECFDSFESLNITYNYSGM